MASNNTDNDFTQTIKSKINLFALNRDEKRKLVIEQYDEIIRYLVDVAEVLCMCELTDHHKRKLLMTTTSSREERVIRLRQEMINILTNYMTLEELNVYCALTGHKKEFMEQAFANLQLSARTFHRILRVARTIADLEGSTDIEEAHLAEALCFRMTGV